MERFHKIVLLILGFVKNQDLQGLFRIFSGKNQVFLPSVPIQVRSLDRLLILPRNRGGKLHAAHGLLNGGLQRRIFLGPLWEAIHLLHRAVAAGAEGQTRRQKQRAKKASLFQGISFLSFLVL